MPELAEQRESTRYLLGPTRLEDASLAQVVAHHFLVVRSRRMEAMTGTGNRGAAPIYIRIGVHFRA